MKKKGNGNRLNRINDEIMQEVAIIIRGELKDPRISTITSVTSVETSSDLKYCKIFVSILGDEKQKNEVLNGLDNSRGFIRKELARRINLRNTPELKFELDTSLDYSMKIEGLLDSIKKED